MGRGRSGRAFALFIETTPVQGKLKRKIWKINGFSVFVLEMILLYVSFPWGTMENVVLWLQSFFIPTSLQASSFLDGSLGLIFWGKGLNPLDRGISFVEATGLSSRWRFQLGQTSTWTWAACLFHQ